MIHNPLFAVLITSFSVDMTTMGPCCRVKVQLIEEKNNVTMENGLLCSWFYLDDLIQGLFTIKGCISHTAYIFSKVISTPNISNY
jgi:hypothetical protein